MKIKPITVDGITYNKFWVGGLQQPLLAVRDELLAQGLLPFAAALSEINVIMEDYKERLES